MKPHKRGQETEAVRGGTDLGKKNGPLVTPIYQTSTFETRLTLWPRRPLPNWRAQKAPCYLRLG